MRRSKSLREGFLVSVMVEAGISLALPIGHPSPYLVWRQGLFNLLRQVLNSQFTWLSLPSVWDDRTMAIERDKFLSLWTEFLSQREAV